jgi:hypothetical protein
VTAPSWFRPIGADRLRATVHGTSIEQPRFVATALLLALGSAAALILYLGSGLTLWRDEWFFVQYRDGHRLDTFLSPHGGHLSLAPITIYKILFKVAGLQVAHYWMYRAVAVSFLVIDGILLWEIGRRRVGPAAALLPPTIVLFLGPGWMDLLWPFQMVFSGAIAAGLGMLLALDRRDKRGDIAACILLAVSLSFSGVGLAFAAGAVVDVLLRPRRLQRAWVFAVPILLWFLWYLDYGRTGSRFRQGNLAEGPSYVLHAASAAVGAMTSVGSTWGMPLALFLAVALIFRMARGGWREARLWSTLAIAFVYWATLALAAAGAGYEPTQTRYLYPGAVFVALVILEAARGHRPNPGQFVLLCVFTAAVLAFNVPKLVHEGFDLRQPSSVLPSELAAVELARNVVDPYFTLSSSGVPIVAAWYLAAVNRWGSPADTPAEVSRRPEATRELVDTTLASAMHLRTVLVRGIPKSGAPPRATPVGTGTTRAVGSCVRLASDGERGVFDLEPRSQAVSISTEHTPAHISIRRFADRFAVRLRDARPDSTVLVSFPPDADPQPWWIRIQALGPVTACAAP